MCVAIYKPKNANTPSLETLKQCWEANPDGAGFAIRHITEKNCIEIRKGFMSWGDFEKAYHDFKLDTYNDDMLLHFRIATSGGVCAGNTHPFPVTPKVQHLKHTDLYTNTALIHNGVLPLTPDNKQLSDTMGLCQLLSGVTGNLKNAIKLVEPLIGTNKLALMLPDTVVLAGQWEQIGGVYFSNLNWQYRAGWFNDWQDDGYAMLATKSELKKLKRGICPICGLKTVSNDPFGWYCESCGEIWDK